ncbi:Phage replication protein CRI (plasmid) [Rivularia sp. PCC 7116]|uniref:phage/plasmid replication domain-containing protein n=1 Tax=Rivularia sp. PCC 7116 TaxID=373994 RepID=UPI00029F0FA2|nr:phage/plasmid replication protein [Rivularia sp. PCC 7116]AFY59260.1 Phage replication protein CRI [Rivularia sp. PCC 7116]
MIDTIKLGIPLTKTQHVKLQKLLAQDENWQWVKFQPSTGEMTCVRSKGLAETDENSYHRDIKFDVDTNYRPDDTYLTFEFSIPKFWIGHNVHLVYDWVTPLEYFRKLLQKQLHCKFPVLDKWKLRRVDVCYAWKLPTQDYAKHVLTSLKGLKYPYKQPIIYPDSIVFPGSTYSLKFYLKLPEFRQHDLRAMVKANYKYEWINWIEERSEGVLRYEATLRRVYLKRNGIDTVKDLKTDKTFLTWNDKFCELNDHIKDDDEVKRLGCVFLIMNYHLRQQGKTLDDVNNNLKAGVGTPLVNGVLYEAPPLTTTTNNGMVLIHKGGGFIYNRESTPEHFLNLFLNKYIGKNRTMDNADLVELKLKQKYKRNKAAHLMGFWLYVERKGMAEAQESYGKTAYYDARKAIYDAGCNFITPPMITDLDGNKLQNFALKLNNPYVVNKEDDNRDSCNLLNLISDINQ